MTAEVAPGIVGVALAGGRSRRMAEDKGGLALHGVTQAEHTFSLLRQFCRRVVVSVRVEQASQATYRDLPQVVDSGSVAGPGAGLLAAWEQFPNCALLVVAIDMPLVDTALLQFLVDRRNPAKIATAFRHDDGLIEPLCTIWEPAAAGLADFAVPDGAPSLRRVLERAPVEFLQPPEPDRLISVNTPESVQAVLRSLRSG